MKKMNEKIKEIIGSGNGVKVYFRSVEYGYTKVNEALMYSEGEKKILLMQELLRCFLEKNEDSKEIWYDLLWRKKENGGCELTPEELWVTLTADGRQLRVWYEKPNIRCAREDHMDAYAAGGGLLFEVTGPPPAVWKYLEGVLEVTPMVGRKFPAWENGGVYYLSKENEEKEAKKM